MDVVHIWHDRWRSKISFSSTWPTPHDLNIKATDFQLIQASYAVCLIFVPVADSWSLTFVVTHLLWLPNYTSSIQSI